MSARGSSGGKAVGIAIAPGRLTARGLAGSGSSARAFTWEHKLPALDASSTEWSAAVADAMRALRKFAPHLTDVHVSLLPPLTNVRVASMPRIAAEELRSVVGRYATRYFPVGTEPQIVQARIARPSSDAMAPHLLTAAPEKIVDAVVNGAAASGFRLGALAPAELAWAAAASRGHGDRSLGLVRFGDRTELLELADGRLTGVRRFRSAGDRDWGEGAASIQTIAANIDDATGLAARHANVALDSSLWPERVYVTRARETWRSAARWAAAAVGMLVASALIAWIGAGRALSIAQAERALIAAQVTHAVDGRDALARMERTRAAISGFGAGRPGWAAAIVEIGRLLPDDASLVSLRAAGDTLFIVGEADHAAPVFTALGASRTFAGVRAEAPIQQQLENGEVVAERFSIAAVIRSTGPAAAGREP